MQGKARKNLFLFLWVAVVVGGFVGGCVSRRPSMLAGPRFEPEATALVVVEEGARLDCTKSDLRPRSDTLRCDLEATWVIHNPTDQAQTAEVSFYRKGVGDWQLVSDREGSLRRRAIPDVGPDGGGGGGDIGAEMAPAKLTEAVRRVH